MEKITSREILHQIREEAAKKISDSRCRILICAGTGCLAGGSGEIYRRMSELAEENPDIDVEFGPEIAHGSGPLEVKKSGCHGFCEMGPLMRIEPAGILYTKVKPEDCDEIFHRTIEKGDVIRHLLFKQDGLEYKKQEEIPFYKKQTRNVLKNCGHIDAEHIEEYISTGGYEALEKVLFEMTPQEVVEEISASNLRGRGALLLMVPVVITFIVSMSSGGGLGVFAVLTASMLLVASLSVVPLLSTQRRITKSILASVTALLLIFFFVDRMNGGGEFILWTIPTIFGLSVVFFPLVIRNITLPPILSDKKALITLAWDTLWLFLTIFEVCNHSGDREGMRAGYIAAFILMAGVWLVFWVARYLPVNGWIKAGTILIISCIWMAFTNDVYVYFAEHKKQLTILSTNFSDWTNHICVNANVCTLILIFGGIAGGGLLVYGKINRKRKCLK